MALLDVRQLSVHFAVRHGVFGRARGTVRAVEEASLGVERGEAVGLVGESGCGKTTLGRAVVRLVERASGEIWFDGEDIGAMKGRALQLRRRKFQMIFQDPLGSLDPRFSMGDSIGEALDIHGLAADRRTRRARVRELLAAVGLEPDHSGRYPHEFSGGQRQRVGIARALAVDPKLMVCDEPVSSLDVSIQAQIVNLLRDLQQARGLAYLFISHDLALVRHLCHRTLVMYLGRIVESGPSDAVCISPRHPYTQALISAVPVLDPDSRRRRMVLGGEVPSPLNPPAGCPFHPRCPIAEARCRIERPMLREIAPGHHVACHLAKA